MKSLIFLLFLCLVHASSKLRLLDFGSKLEWVSQETKDRLLKTRGKIFADVTDHQHDFASPVGLTFPETCNGDNDEMIGKLLSSVSQVRGQKTVTSMSSLYTRYYQNGVQASETVAQLFKTIPALQVEMFQHADFPQQTVIARLQGSNNNNDDDDDDDDDDDGVVIIGAHLDSINQKMPTTGRAPGADDDASGVALVLEAARLLSSGVSFSRTIEFHAYAAEEAGLLGSMDVARKYRAEQRPVRGMLQLDQAGYLAPDIEPTIGILTDTVNPELAEFLRDCALTWSEGTRVRNATCGYPCSDQASWTKYGYPSCHESEGTPLFNNTSPYSHTPKDTISTINWPHWEQLTRVAIAWAYQLAV